MNILVWPDVHHRIDVLQNFLERNGSQYDQRIFLGDFQDQFNDTPAHAKRTAIMVKRLLEDPRNIICFGNHDLPYMYPWNSSVSCPGWNEDKSKAVNSILTYEDWRKMRFAVAIDNWLFSHAGIRASLFREMTGILDFTAQDVVNECNAILPRLDVNSWHFLARPGADRGFSGQQFGGITWLDYGNLSLRPGVNQVVGHTPLDRPVLKYGFRGGNIKTEVLHTPTGQIHIPDECVCVNACIDTSSEHFAVLEDSVLHIYSTIDFL